MSLGILNTHPPLRNWLLEIFPNILIEEEVTAQLMEQEKILLVSFYEINQEHFQIIDLWKNFLEFRNNSQCVGLLGWQKGEGSNYLSVLNEKDKIKKKLGQLKSFRGIVRAGGDPKKAFPNPVFQDIIPTLTQLFLSHGTNAFQKLLISISSPLVAMEQELEEGRSITHVLQGRRGTDVNQAFRHLQRIWEDRRPYFALMPQFPALLAFESILADWRKLKERGRIEGEPLSDRISDYLEETISDISELYDMDI